LRQGREGEGQQISGKSGDWIRGEIIPSHIETFVSDHRGSPNPVGGPLNGPLLMLVIVYCLTGIQSSGKTFGVIRPVETPERSCTKIYGWTDHWVVVTNVI